MVGEAIQGKIPVRSRHIDLLNIAACFSVIVLHSTGEVFSFSESGTWLASILLQTLCHFSVPVFFMISGVTLLNYRKRYTTKEYFLKRWQRIGIPFLFWTCFYIIWNQLVLKAPPLHGPMDVVNIFFNNGATNIFWFFYALIPIYLLMPAFSLIDWQKNRRVLFYLLLLSFFFNQILPLLSRFAGINLTPYADLPFKFDYWDYAFLGYFLQYLRITPMRRWLIYGAGIIGFVGMAGGTWLLSRASGATDIYFMDYHSVFCYFLAVAAFVLVRDLCQIKESIGKKIQTDGHTLQNLSGASFGIYLIHILVMTVLLHFIVFPHPVIEMTLGAVLVYIVSAGFTLLIKKIPIVKRVMP